MLGILNWETMGGHNAVILQSDSLNAWSFLDMSGGPYLTYKAAKKSVYFCGP